LPRSHVEADFLLARDERRRMAVDLKFFPEPAENEPGSYLLGLGIKVALFGQHEERLSEKAGEERMSCLHLALGLNLIHAPYRGITRWMDLLFSSGFQRSEVFAYGPAFLTLANMGVSS